MEGVHELELYGVGLLGGKNGDNGWEVEASHLCSFKWLVTNGEIVE